MNGQCEHVEGLIVDYALGELDGSRVEAVREHIRSCPGCSESLKEVQRLVSSLCEGEVLEPSAALCHSVREAVREKVFLRRSPLAGLATVANSFVRRPLLAGAAAVVVIAAMALLVVVPGFLRQSKQGPGSLTERREGAKTLREFGDYLSESRELVKSLQGTGAGELLVSHDWKDWVAQAMDRNEMRGFEAYQPLLRDMIRLYKKIEDCRGQFGEEQVLEIRKFISQKDLVTRIENAAGSTR